MKKEQIEKEVAETMAKELDTFELKTLVADDAEKLGKQFRIALNDGFIAVTPSVKLLANNLGPDEPNQWFQIVGKKRE